MSIRTADGKIVKLDELETPASLQIGETHVTALPPGSIIGHNATLIDMLYFNGKILRKEEDSGGLVYLVVNEAGTIMASASPASVFAHSIKGLGNDIVGYNVALVCNVAVDVTGMDTEKLKSVCDSLGFPEFQRAEFIKHWVDSFILSVIANSIEAARTESTKKNFFGMKIYQMFKKKSV